MFLLQKKTQRTLVILKYRAFAVGSYFKKVVEKSTTENNTYKKTKGFV
jgi:hypothetical protein